MKPLKIIFLFALAITLTACLSLGKSTPQTQYMFDVNNSIAPQFSPQKTTLQVTSLKILPQYSGNSFVYRVNSLQYLTDYYHVFFVPADQQLTQITTGYLSNTHLFSLVGNAYNIIGNPTYYLSGTIVALYADYRDTAHPVARISIQYTLFNNRTQKIVLNKVYATAIPITQKNSPALIQAWNSGLAIILRDLAGDIKRAV